MGPVGPGTWDAVHPKTAAKNPTAITPESPAIGTIPEATPNARARGSATTAAVIPPYISPRMEFASNFPNEFRLMVDYLNYYFEFQRMLK